MTDPLPALSWSLFPYLLLAGFMVGTNLYFLTRLFPRTGGAPTYSTVILVVGLLVMSSGLWAAAAYAIESPGEASTVAVFVAGNSMMSVFGLWAIGLFFRSEERRLAAGGWAGPLSFGTLVVVSELLMGLAFYCASAPPAEVAAASPVALFTASAVSVWFFWAMFGNMLLVILWIPLAPAERGLLAAFALSSLVGPWIAADPSVGAAAMGGTMAVALALGLRELGRGRVTVSYARLAIGVLVGFGVMSAGVLVSLLGPLRGSSFPFALASLLVMAGEIFFLARRSYGGVPRAATPFVGLDRAPAEVRADVPGFGPAH